MNEQAFELTSLAMRYWFAILIALAVLCALRLTLVDRRRARLERRNAPNMEIVGEVLVVKGADEIKRGERFTITRDFVIGRRRKCDLCLHDRSVFPRHARGELRNGGMLIGAIGRAPVSLNGQPLESEILVHDGDLFCIGALVLQLTLYDVTVEYDVDADGHVIDAHHVSGSRPEPDITPFDHEFDDAITAPEELPDELPDFDEEIDAAPDKGNDLSGDEGFDVEADAGAAPALPDYEEPPVAKKPAPRSTKQAAPTRMETARAARGRRTSAPAEPPEIPDRHRSDDLPDYDDDTDTPPSRKRTPRRR